MYYYHIATRYSVPNHLQVVWWMDCLSLGIFCPNFFLRFSPFRLYSLLITYRGSAHSKARPKKILRNVYIIPSVNSELFLLLPITLSAFDQRMGVGGWWHGYWKKEGTKRKKGDYDHWGKEEEEKDSLHLFRKQSFLCSSEVVLGLSDDRPWWMCLSDELLWKSYKLNTWQV